MKIKGIIFDLDGVLCSTDEYHYRAWKVVAQRLKIPFDRKINDRLRGVSRMESLNIILENYQGIPLSIQEKEMLADEKNNYYRKLLADMTPEMLAETVVDTLHSLKNKGFKLAVGSSSKNAEFILDQLQITELFDAICDGNQIKYSKPNPEVFLRAAKMLGLKNEECLVVEDAISGVQAGKTAKMKVAGIGEAGKSDLADYSITKLKQILDILV